MTEPTTETGKSLADGETDGLTEMIVQIETEAAIAALQPIAEMPHNSGNVCARCYAVGQIERLQKGRAGARLATRLDGLLRSGASEVRF